MSSIDKYVKSEARSINPRIVVRNQYGYISGYIDGRKVFSIADRYGYIRDGEKNIIRNSINQYEEEERERERLEELRIENERVEARTRLRNKLRSAKADLQSSYASAKRICDQARRDADFSKELKKLSEFDVSSYTEEVRKINASIDENERIIEADYKRKIAELYKIEKAVRDDSVASLYRSQKTQADRIRTNVETIAIPLKKVGELRTELNRIASLTDEVVALEKKLKRFGSDGPVGRIAANANSAIKGTQIRSVGDIENLIYRINEIVSAAENLNFSEECREIKDEVSAMKGIAKSCNELYSGIHAFAIQNYQATSYGEEIAELSDKIRRIFDDIKSAEYTTCSDEIFAETSSVLQEVAMTGKSDIETLDVLRELYDKGVEIQNEDSLHAEEYSDYLRKVKELEQSGTSKDSIEAFDPANYSKQAKRLNALLLKQDLDISTAQTRATFLMACQAMEDSGYKMLSSDWGLSENGDNEEIAASKGLACEAAFVIPGCEGVVFQVVASDCGVIRRLVGIQRRNGTATSAERIKEVAKKIEDSGEIPRFFGAYSRLGGGNLAVQDGAVDSDSENCDSAIREMGKFVFSSEEEENFFDKLVELGTVEEKRKWESKIARTANRSASSVAENDCRQIVDRMRTARYQEKKSKRHGD